MKTLLPRLAALLTAAFLFAACGHDHDHGDDHGHDHPAEGGSAGAAPGGHTHEHGERHPLGSVTVGGHEIAVFRLVELVPGTESDFDLDFAAAPLPATVRGWIGVESGQGSRKVRFENETPTRMHGHPEVPDPMPAGSRLWLEVEAAGATSRTSVGLDG